MIFRILIELAALFALFWSIKSQRPLPIIITIVMIAGIIFTLFPVKEIGIPGIYIYMASLVLVFIYAFTKKSISVVPRIMLLLMAACLFLFWLWVENHWHGNTNVFLALTLIALIVALFYRRSLKNEYGFMAIIGMDAFTLILEHLLK